MSVAAALLCAVPMYAFPAVGGLLGGPPGVLLGMLLLVVLASPVIQAVAREDAS